MSNLYINKITEENIQDILDKIEDATTVYIDSDGGNCCLFMIIKDALNKRSDKIKLIASGALHSMAFPLFFGYTGEKEVKQYTTSRLHYSGQNKRVMCNGKFEYDQDKESKAQDKEDYEYEKKECKRIGLTDDEISKLEEGNYLELTTNRLRELLKYNT